MNEPIDHEKLKRLISDITRRHNIKSAVHQAPTHSLSDILDLRSITKLRQLGRALQVKYYGKLAKPELISKIVDLISQPDGLIPLLNNLDKPAWQFFQTAAAENEHVVDSLYPELYLMAQLTGLMQSFYHNGNIIFIVPDEIKKSFDALKAVGYIEEKDFRDDVVDMAIAAVNLYGVISQEDFVSLFNSYHERQTDEDEVFSILISQVYAQIGFSFWDDYIVDDSFEEDDFKGVRHLLRDRRGKPRYNPPFDEFIKYADWNYFEDTPQLEALRLALGKHIANPDEVLDLVEELYDAFRAEWGMQEYMDLLSDHGVVFDDMNQVKAMLQLLVDAKNNTRLWQNHGHTPRELASRGRSKIIPFPGTQQQQAVKVGRNELCPCGSGKKYKNCCGKTT